MGDLHVKPAGEGIWIIEEEGTGKVHGTYKYQGEATLVARPKAQENKVQLLIYGRDGKLRKRQNYQ